MILQNWRMLPDTRWDTTQIHQTVPVELQFFNRCSSNRRDPQNLRAVIAPDKMVAPAVLARVKQRYGGLANRIECLSTGIFSVITPLTGERQIIGCTDATF